MHPRTAFQERAQLESEIKKISNTKPENTETLFLLDKDFYTSLKDYRHKLLLELEASTFTTGRLFYSPLGKTPEAELLKTSCWNRGNTSKPFYERLTELIDRFLNNKSMKAIYKIKKIEKPKNLKSNLGYIFDQIIRLINSTFSNVEKLLSEKDKFIENEINRFYDHAFLYYKEHLIEEHREYLIEQAVQQYSTALSSRKSKENVSEASDRVKMAKEAKTLPDPSLDVLFILLARHEELSPNYLKEKFTEELRTKLYEKFPILTQKPLRAYQLSQFKNTLSAGAEISSPSVPDRTQKSFGS